MKTKVKVEKSTKTVKRIFLTKKDILSLLESKFSEKELKTANVYMVADTEYEYGDEIDIQSVEGQAVVIRLESEDHTLHVENL